MRTMARTEPPTIVSCIRQRYTSQVGAHTDNNKPFWVLHSHRVFLWITQFIHMNWVCKLNISFCTMSYKHRFSTPFHSDSGSWFDASNINLQGCHSKHITTGWHGQHQLEHHQPKSWCINETTTWNTWRSTHDYQHGPVHMRSSN